MNEFRKSRQVLYQSKEVWTLNYDRCNLRCVYCMPPSGISLKPSAEILKRIARGLSVSAETLFEQAGLLEGREVPNLENAIDADITLSERQKQALREIYRSFQTGNEEERS